MRKVAIALAVLLCGCPSDWEVVEPPEGWTGVANPAPVDNPVQVDRIRQVVDPVVDVLWVVDNSTSMSDDREKLAQNFPVFMEWFERSGIDYHIGVVTTDMDKESHSGLLREAGDHRWIDPETDDQVARFTHMTTDMGAGSAREKGREAAFYALEMHKDGYNAGFLREGDGGYLHITVVSDEDDDSDKAVISKKEFAAYVNDLKPQWSRTTFNSIVKLAVKGPFEEVGTKYLWLTDEIGGVERDLDTANWTDLLDDLGGLYAPPPAEEWYLSRLPVPETLDVKVETPEGVTLVYTQNVHYTWSHSRNSIAFVDAEDNLEPGAEIIITYTVAASVLTDDEDEDTTIPLIDP